MQRRSAPPPQLLAAVTGGLILAAGVVAAAGAGGCTQAAIAPRETSTASVPRAEAVPTRPTVKVTAADMYSWGPGASAQQLEFYDEVESRDIVAQDDVLHAALLFGRGSSAPTFAQRSALAREQGWLDRSFNRPAAEAATVGEVSQIMARVMGLDGSSPSRAVGALAEAGVLPEGLTAQQGISGRQFLALLGRSYDWLQRDSAGAGAHRPLAARPPAVDLETQALARTPEPQPAAPAPPVSRPAPAPAARAAAEPLPDLPRKDPAPVAAKDEPPPVPPPAPAPAAEEAKPAPAPTPRPWVGGKPLGKKR